MTLRLRPLGCALLVASLGAPIGCSDESVQERGMALVADSEDLRTYRAGRAWAVVIGIDDYTEAPRLNYAVADAKAVGGLLAERGFEVTELMDGEATSDAILGEIGDELPKRVSPEDRVVIFFAGHGQTRKFEGGGEMGFLLPVDASLGKLRQTAIDMGVVKSLADELPAKHVLFLIDACYGGIAGLRGRTAAGADTATTAYLRSITRDRGRQLITAGGADEEAHESAEWGHSAFTHVLLKGLREGLADLNEDGIVPASELHQYLERNVFDAVRHVQAGGRADAELASAKEQRPQLWELAPDRGEFVFFVDSAAGEQLAREDRTRVEPLANAGAEALESNDAAESDAPAANASAEESAALRAEMARLQELQDSLSGSIEQLDAQAQDAIRQIRADGEPERARVTRPSLPPKDWTCTGNKVVVNGKKLSNMQLVQLTLLAGGNTVAPGCYWYDAATGMWGWEGQPSAGDMPVGLEIGGPLRADASSGDTLVFLNGRELTQLEAQRLGSFGGPRRPGRYWMNAQGVGGAESQSASFNITAGVAAAQAAAASGQNDAGSGNTDSFYQSGDTHGGVQGDCVYLSGSDYSYIGDGCD